MIPYNLGHGLVPEFRAGLVKTLSFRSLLTAVFFATASVAVAGPFEDGQAAYNRHDYATALQVWRPLADHGNAKAQNKLGNMYVAGEGVPQDYAEAVKWYRKAADQGLAVAQGSLGFMYANGQGVPQDYREAMKWFRKAADQGYANAQHNLGVMYRDGQGVAAGLCRGREVVPPSRRSRLSRCSIQSGRHV